MPINAANRLQNERSNRPSHQPLTHVQSPAANASMSKVGRPKIEEHLRGAFTAKHGFQFDEILDSEAEAKKHGVSHAAYAKLRQLEGTYMAGFTGAKETAIFLEKIGGKNYSGVWARESNGVEHVNVYDHLTNTLVLRAVAKRSQMANGTMITEGPSFEAATRSAASDV